MSSLDVSAQHVMSKKGPLGPGGFDWITLVALFVGFSFAYGPTFYELANTIWRTDEQGHGPIILAISWWLLYKRREEIVRAAGEPRTYLGSAIFVFAMLMYVIGRSQQIIMFQAASHILVLVSLLLIFCGSASLKVAGFPLFFLIFTIPLPEALVAAITAPLKTAVSSVASTVLYELGYPIGRSGVMLTIGQYQLLVADACAGLNSMFTLEALGLLYMNLMNYSSLSRNLAIATLLIPISFVANVTRVIILVLVTYYFGDEVGQGYVHGFAGMVLFLVALFLMLVVDRILGVFLPGLGIAVSTRHLKALIMALLMIAVSAAVPYWQPSKHLTDLRPKIDLEALFPRQFGDWKVDNAIPVQMVAPDVQALLNELYNQVLERTYVNSQGARIMLSVAYGGDQSDATRAHWPEVCYPARVSRSIERDRGRADVERHAAGSSTRHEARAPGRAVDLLGNGGRPRVVEWYGAEVAADVLRIQGHHPRRHAGPRLERLYRTRQRIRLAGRLHRGYGCRRREVLAYPRVRRRDLTRVGGASRGQDTVRATIRLGAAKLSRSAALRLGNRLRQGAVRSGCRCGVAGFQQGFGRR